MKNFSLKDVHSSDELFVTGTFAGVIPVVSVDKIIIRGIRGKITKNLQDWYSLDLENVAKKMNKTYIAMWSGPRNLSTL